MFLHSERPYSANFFIGIVLLHSVGFAGDSTTHVGQRALKVYFQKESPQQNIGMKKLSQAARVTYENAYEKADIVIITTEDLSTQMNVQLEYSSMRFEGYAIKKTSSHAVAIISSDHTGAMYGMMDLAEQFQMGRSLSAVVERTVHPAIGFRGIKFNLPWNSYRKDESLQLHEATVRDLRYWESFLDMMAENRFNALTLWNLHPFTSMIRAKHYPEACPYSNTELKEWQVFWHRLFTLAADRGIRTYIFNWNIMVSHSFAEAHGVAEYCLDDYQGKNFIGKGDYSPIIQQYMRESIVQLIEEYPELTGIGVSQNERMEGVPEQVWQDWIVNTYFNALDSANRKIDLIIRAHTHPAPEMTRKAVEENAYRLGTVYVDVKFNWSHAHATPDLMYIHGGSTSKALWEPAPKNYTIIYTMRNEDFFVLRWGEPEFIRNIIKRNAQQFVGGFLIGSETYIPGKEYITKPGKHLTWKYAFEKQWLFYEMWGRLMYDPQTCNDVFASTFDRKYGITCGDRLIEAHSLADQMPLKLASFYASSWDFTLYSEGFLANAPSRMGCLYDSLSPFISVNEIIETTPLDTNLVSIKDYVNGKYHGSTKITPLQLSDELQRHGKAAIALLQGIRTANPTVTHEIDDIKTWAYLSLYFGEKLKAGTALQRFRLSGDPERHKESVHSLEQALRYWEDVVSISRKYIDEIPLMHLNPSYVNSGNRRQLKRFSWANLSDEVRNDIAIAKMATPKPRSRGQQQQ